MAARPRGPGSAAGGGAFWRPLVTVAVLVALAEGAKRAGLLPVFVPAPSEVVDQVLSEPDLAWSAMSATGWRAATGFLISAAITLAAAGLAVSVRALYSPVYNTGVILHAIPVIATTPLLALWAGTGQQLQVIVSALACQFPLLVGAIQGMRAADARQRELMHVLAASRSQTLRYLLVPSALPYVFAGGKIAGPAAVLGSTTAEWAGAERGVGAMMLYALFSYDTPKVWLAVVLTCVLAIAAYGVWSLVEAIVLRGAAGIELKE